jgi:hypothetical protein
MSLYDEIRKCLEDPDNLGPEFKAWLPKHLEMHPPRLLAKDIAFGPTPTYTVTNLSTDRAYDANATTTAELADVLGTLLADLKEKGII